MTERVVADRNGRKYITNEPLLHRPEADCRSCRKAWTRDGYEYGCKSTAICTNADRYEALPPVRLWRTDAVQQEAS